MAAVKFHWRREWFSWFVKKLRGIHIPSRHRQVFSFHLLCLIIKQLISYHWRCLSLLASSQHVLLTQLNVKNADNWDESGRKWEVVPESFFQRRPPAPGVCASCLVPWAPLRKPGPWVAEREKYCAGDNVPLFCLLQTCRIRTCCQGTHWRCDREETGKKPFLCSRPSHSSLKRWAWLGRRRKELPPELITGYAGSVASLGSRHLWLSCGLVIAGGGAWRTCLSL